MRERLLSTRKEKEAKSLLGYIPDLGPELAIS
jgi:hypothetical protein